MQKKKKLAFLDALNLFIHALPKSGTQSVSNANSEILKFKLNFFKLNFLGWIYVNSEGVKVKSIRAAMRYEAIKTSEKEIRQRKMNSTL